MLIWFFFFFLNHNVKCHYWQVVTSQCIHGPLQQIKLSYVILDEYKWHRRSYILKLIGQCLHRSSRVDSNWLMFASVVQPMHQLGADGCVAMVTQMYLVTYGCLDVWTMYSFILFMRIVVESWPYFIMIRFYHGVVESELFPLRCTINYSYLFHIINVLETFLNT